MNLLKTKSESTVIKRKLRDWLMAIRDALTPVEDQWTWTMADGAVLEEVEVIALEADKVILQHKFGKACVPIDQLSEDSRLKLERDYRDSV